MPLPRARVVTLNAALGPLDYRVPDGMAVDTDGTIWSARWGGNAIFRYSSDGELLETFPMPVNKVTSVTFAGDGYDEAYATSGGGQDRTVAGVDAATLARGQQLYTQHCASCHGAELEGQPNWRQRRADGRLPAPPHDASGHKWHHSDAQLFKLTKRGPAGLVPGYASDMPAFGGVLDDDEIRAVLLFIKSTWPADIRARQEALGTAGQRR